MSEYWVKHSLTHLGYFVLQVIMVFSVLFLAYGLIFFILLGDEVSTM